MDFISKAMGGGDNNNTQGTTENVQTGQQTSSSSGGGFMDKLQGIAGGGRESEKNEDYVDKGTLLPNCTSRLQEPTANLIDVRRRLRPGAFLGTGTSG
jgi:hypothetical protein